MYIFESFSREFNRVNLNCPYFLIIRSFNRHVSRGPLKSKLIYTSKVCILPLLRTSKANRRIEGNISQASCCTSPVIQATERPDENESKPTKIVNKIHSVAIEPGSVSCIVNLVCTEHVN